MTKNSKSIRLIGIFFLILFLFNGEQAMAWDLPKLPKIPVPDIFPDGTGKGTSELLGCGLGGVTGALAAKQLAAVEAKKKHLTGSQEDKLAKRYMLGFGLAGCMVGKSTAGAIYDKLTERAKQKREETLQAAIKEETEIHRSGQPVSGKSYSWEMDGASGEIKVADVNEDDDGRICVVVDENIEVEGETAQPLTKRCNTPPSPEWVVAAS